MLLKELLELTSFQQPLVLVIRRLSLLQLHDDALFILH